MVVIIQIVTCLRTKLATLKQLIGYIFEGKNISQKGTSIENIGRFEGLNSARNKNTVNTA